MGRSVRVVFVLLALVCAATIDPSVGARQGHQLSSGRLRAARGDRVVVEVFHTLSDAQARRGVERAGGRVSGLVPGVLVQADVPVRNLASLESTPGISFVRPPRRINVVPRDADGPSAGNRRRGRGGLVGQEVTKTNAAAWQAAGQRGAGVKIGIVDLFSRKKYSKAQRRKQVPTPAGTVCFFQGAPCDVFSVSDRSEAHGTAVAEVVHEMAPRCATLPRHGGHRRRPPARREHIRRAGREDRDAFAHERVRRSGRRSRARSAPSSTAPSPVASRGSTRRATAPAPVFSRARVRTTEGRSPTRTATGSTSSPPAWRRSGSRVSSSPTACDGTTSTSRRPT